MTDVYHNYVFSCFDSDTKLVLFCSYILSCNNMNDFLFYNHLLIIYFICIIIITKKSKYGLNQIGTKEANRTNVQILHQYTKVV